MRCSSDWRRVSPIPTAPCECPVTFSKRRQRGIATPATAACWTPPFATAIPSSRRTGPARRLTSPNTRARRSAWSRYIAPPAIPKYWQLAKFFLDQRGRDDYPRRGEYALDRTYAQDHAPVVKQTEAVGHCVRATFLYIALADLAALTGSGDYAQALRKIWEDATYRKMYVTGGIGSIRFHEQFGAPYELPNLSAWNETCAAYGNIVWNHRMFLLHEDAAYIDVMERVLYNSFAAGVSLKGDRFFYQNPLKSFGNYERFEWINTPCCPPNVVRLMASLGNYVYAQSPAATYVNLYVAGTATIDGVKIVQETRYPLDGDVTIRVDPPEPKTFTLALRIPGWAQNTAVPGLYDFIDFAARSPRSR